MAEIEILDTADQPLTSPVAIGPLAPGQTSTPLDLRAWWARGEPGEADQSDGALVGLARLAGGADPYQGDSTRLQLAGGLEMRVTGGAWVALRAGTALRLPVIPADAFLAVQLRVTAPIGSGSALDVEVLIEPHVLRTSAWSADLLPGVILSGLGDRRRSGIYAQAGTVDAQGPETDTVDTPAVSWLAEGAAHHLAGGTFTPDALDGAGEALGAGEGYVSALTLGGNGAYVQAKGLRAALPLDELDRPAVPSSTPVLAWIVRDDSATIGAGDITQGPGAGFFGATSAGLDVTIAPDGPGASVGGRHVLYRTPQVLAMTASTTQTIYLLPDSSLEVVAAGGQPVDPLAIPLWRVTTDASTVTALVDLRVWSPAPMAIRWAMGAMTTGATVYATTPRALDVLAVDGQALLALVDDPGSGGSTDVVIEASVPGSGSWTTIATLSVAQGTTPASATAQPTGTTIAAGSILRATVTAQTATAQPTGAAVVLLAR